MMKRNRAPGDTCNWPASCLYRKR